MTSNPQRPSSVRARSAFSLIEAMVALSITAMAGAVLLLATEGVMETTNDAVAQTIAQGMAAQLIDEVLGARYHEPGDSPYSRSLGANGSEHGGNGRERYDDADDYNGFTSSPPEDMYGRELGKGNNAAALRNANFRSPGNDFSKWTQRIDVYYVDPNNPALRRPNNQPTDYRAVEVTIQRLEPSGGVRTLAKLRRVFCYVPTP